MPDLGSDITDLGGAIGSLFTSQGNAAQAKDFQGASTLATQNAQLAAASTRIQATQTARSVAQSLGTTNADVAGAGFTTSGSALDILKSSASQGALAKSLVNIQGAINENSYAAQAGAYSGEATAAKEASTAGTIGAIGAIGGALVSGTNQLASAGKTVVDGYDYVTGLFSGDASATITADGIGASATDAAITSGATDLTLDTSGIALGTTTEAAEAGVADAAGDAVTAGLVDSIGADAIGGAAVDAGAADFAADAGLEVGADVAGDAAADFGIGDALSAIGDVAIAAC